MVPGGYEAIVEEIARLQPDFVCFSEVRNYRNTRFNERIVASLKEKGLSYYSFYSYDSGLLSRHPISDSLTIFPEDGDHGSIYKLTSSVHGQKVAIYTAHLDYLNCAYYDVKGYDGSAWKERPKVNSVEEALRLNELSRRDEAIKAFIESAREDLENGYCVVIGGDFNEPSHYDWVEANKNLYDHNGLVIPWTVSTLCQEAGFTDAYRKVHPNPLKYPGISFPSDNPLIAVEKLTWAPKSDERERIDFILYQGKNIKAVKALMFGPKTSIARSRRVAETSKDKFIQPLGIWPTDHKGLLVTFKLK